jgi:uncharacterized membrane protein
MLLITSSAHFTKTKEDLIRITPGFIPFRRQVIAITGVLELLGAVGLLIAWIAPLAGICLALLFVAMFPANVQAALQQLTLRGRQATPLVMRLPMQLAFIAITLWSTQAGALFGQLPFS